MPQNGLCAPHPTPRADTCRSVVIPAPLVMHLKELAHPRPPLLAGGRPAVWITRCQAARHEVAHREIRHVGCLAVHAHRMKAVEHRRTDVLANGGGLTVVLALTHEVAEVVIILRTVFHANLFHEREALLREALQARSIFLAPVCGVASRLDDRQYCIDIASHARILFAPGQRVELILSDEEPRVDHNVREPPVATLVLHILVVAHVQTVLLKVSARGVRRATTRHRKSGHEPFALGAHA
mmetsp:Transcript_27449/g.86154  ORF Transcript_27449/g.86154 Transcript_27449/m.86154 type:complete len:240 (-) Transcript_27449:96-815(-)